MAAPTPPASAAASAGGDLLQAFLRGAGMTQLKVDPAGAEAQMEAIGRSYRGLVEGLVDVLRARASLKGEFRMAQTMIQPVQNNPLKFAPNVDEAMLLLLRRDNQAFMAPDRAVADSFEDLKAHQLAVMAGVQAAIRHLLARFEPAALEARFGKPAGLSGLLPGPARHRTGTVSPSCTRRSCARRRTTSRSFSAANSAAPTRSTALDYGVPDANEHQEKQRQ